MRDPAIRRTMMVTRRALAGVASCAICAATGLVATEVAAQNAPPVATTPGVTRKVLSQMDGPAPGYYTIIVQATIEPGMRVARHTHPGIETGYVIEGNLELPIQGQATRALKAGDAFQVPPETPHAGGKPSDGRIRVISTYMVQKGKPLASPA
jgi:quercetin dioxygenase-like cupin family protein